MEYPRKVIFKVKLPIIKACVFHKNGYTTTHGKEWPSKQGLRENIWWLAIRGINTYIKSLPKQHFKSDILIPGSP